MIERHLDVADRRRYQLGRVAQVEQELLEPQLEGLVRHDEKVFGGAHASTLIVGRERVLRSKNLVEV